LYVVAPGVRAGVERAAQDASAGQRVAIVTLERLALAAAAPPARENHHRRRLA
jgi:hypothetical protein